MFRRGLKDNVKDELMRYRGRIDNLGELVKVAIELDDQLYERSIERRYDSKISRKQDTYPTNYVVDSLDYSIRSNSSIILMRWTSSSTQSRRVVQKEKVDGERVHPEEQEN